MIRGPPIAPPLPRPPPPPPMMLPPTMQGQTTQSTSQPIQHMAAAPQVSTQRPNSVGMAYTQRLLATVHE